MRRSSSLHAKAVSAQRVDVTQTASPRGEPGADVADQSQHGAGYGQQPGQCSGAAGVHLSVPGAMLGSAAALFVNLSLCRSTRPWLSRWRRRPTGDSRWEYAQQFSSLSNLVCAQVPADNVTGEGQTMGALYWQLNDIWQGASWSSLDHGEYAESCFQSQLTLCAGGGWKLSHYYAEQFFRPTIVSPIINGDNVELWLICDQYSDEDILLGYFTYKYSGHGSGWRLINPDKCDTIGAKKVADIPLLEILQYGNCTEGSYDGYRKEYCLIGFGFMNNSTSEYYTTSLPPTKVSES